MTTVEEPQAPGWASHLYTRFVPLDDIEILSRAKGGDGRTVAAYAALFDVQAEVRDRDGHYIEQNERGAFTKTLTERAGRIGVFYNHAKTLHGTPSERGSMPLGTPIDMREDARGWLTVTRYNKTPLAEEVLEAITSGSIRGQSYTGAFIQSDPPRPPYYSRAGELIVVTRKEIAVSEYGPTPIPTYDSQDMVVGVRSASDREREVIEVTTPTDADAQAHKADGVPSDDESTPVGTAAAERTAAAEPEAAETTSETDEPREHSEGNQERNFVMPEETATTTAEPQSAQTQRATWTVEEREARRSEIRARTAEIDAEYSGSELPREVQTEWDELNDELDGHGRAIDASLARRARLAEIADNPNATERVDNSRAGFGSVGVAPRRPDNIYDLTEARSRARSIDELPGIYRDCAMRAIEVGQYPGVSAVRGGSREAAQNRAAELLDGPDHEKGDLARRIMATGSKTYERAFFKAVIRGGMIGLTSEEQRALTMGTLASPDDASLPVPFQLDPTIILTSAGVVNPLRQMARVETITGKAWQGVTSAGVTVSRTLEADREAGDDAPTDLAQPEVKPEAVHGFVPFTIEADSDWGQLRSEMTRLLNDGKETEEATAFVTGNGTPPNPQGVVAGLTASQEVDVTMTSTDSDDVLYNVEEALPDRFLPRAQWLARRATYNFVRQLGSDSDGGDLWVRLAAGQPPELIGYPARIASTVPAMAQGNRFLLFGDFMAGFLIVDKAGMGVELIPHLFHLDNNRPSGQRGIYALWRNSSLVLVPNAFRVALAIT